MSKLLNYYYGLLQVHASEISKLIYYQGLGSSSMLVICQKYMIMLFFKSKLFAYSYNLLAILDLQPISRDTPDNVSRPRWLFTHVGREREGGGGWAHALPENYELQPFSEMAF